ncbi:hypothetical protein VZT92_026866 [Zoarces viviparus]|uniref:Uncharacterized protein n=1 Tax=Zoarces viviparus TaxID=48416 RepID=A0AAW1DTM3_ZOAVI
MRCQTHLSVQYSHRFITKSRHFQTHHEGSFISQQPGTRKDRGTVLEPVAGNTLPHYPQKRTNEPSCSRLVYELLGCKGGCGILICDMLTNDGTVLPAALPFGATVMTPGEVKCG